jgi:octaprenyl-diphosphate synthase
MSSALFEKVKIRVPDQVMAEMIEGALAVEEILKKEAGSEVKAIEGSIQLTLSSGGKRLRPMIALLSQFAVNPDADKASVYKVGAALEMIHMATLIHDDVIDEAATRRGKPTASSVYGNTQSILSGDVLLSRAMRLLAEAGSIEVIREVSIAVAMMAEGEVAELEVRGDFDLNKQKHFEILHLKTGAFIEACCLAGAELAGATKQQKEALGEYGRSIGLAFQIADDLLDYRGAAAKTGKTRATDFREGCATLPLMLLRDKLTEEEITVIKRRFGNGVTDDEIDMICGWMEDRGAFAGAEAEADQLVEQALESLKVLPDSPFREFLLSVSEFVVTRDA